MSSLDALAQHAAGRLDSMSLDEQAEVLALLDVGVQVQPDGRLEITGTVRDLDLPAEPDTTGTKVLHSHGPPARRVTPRLSRAPAPWGGNVTRTGKAGARLRLAAWRKWRAGRVRGSRQWGAPRSGGRAARTPPPG